ncbi:MAG: hypothetical protein ACKKMW_02040 [Candidatus Nealsonbacteria bacterium]
MEKDKLLARAKTSERKVKTSERKAKTSERKAKTQKKRMLRIFKERASKVDPKNFGFHSLTGEIYKHMEKEDFEKSKEILSIDKD